MPNVGHVLRKVDRVQQQHHLLGFAFAVNKKFSDDRAGMLTAIITYYVFLSLFPALLILVTVLGIVAGGNRRLEHDVVGSALSQFPIIGAQIGDNIHRLHANSPVGLIVGLLGLTWGVLGAVQNGQYAMAEVWNIPKAARPGFGPRIARSAAVLGALLVFLGASSLFTAVATVGGHTNPWWRLGGFVLSTLTNGVLMVVLFRLLTPKQIESRDLLLGALVAAGAWSVLQGLGGYLVAHELKHTSQIYGFFAIVLGALWWIYLMTRMVFYAAELNVVRARQLWPRSLTQQLPTPADERMLRAYPQMEQRLPDVRVDVETDPGRLSTPTPPPTPPRASRGS